MKTHDSRQPHGRRVLAKKLALANISINLLVATIIAAWMIYGNYHNEIVTTRRRLDEIGKTIVPGLVNSIWQVNEYGIDERLDEISGISGVEYVRLQSEQELRERGQPESTPQLTRTYPLTYVDQGRFNLGTLTVEAGWAAARQRLQRQAIQIGIATLASTLAGTLLILLLIQLWVTKPLEAMSSYLGALRVEKLNTRLVTRNAKPNRSPDEIDQVTMAINRMRKYLAKNIARRIRNEEELRAHRGRLEILVKERTAALEEKTLQLQVQSQTFEKMANTDVLTGASSRRFFTEMAKHEIARCSRSGASLALMLMDIDHFKKINDTHGHAAGDQVLAGLAGACRSHLREIDLLGRLGGEEFGLLLPEIDIDGALIVAERLRSALESLTIPLSDNGEVRFTVSIGVCMLANGRDDYESLMEHADSALYGAKECGRNRVSVFNAAAG